MYFACLFLCECSLNAFVSLVSMSVDNDFYIQLYVPNIDILSLSFFQSITGFRYNDHNPHIHWGVLFRRMGSVVWRPGVEFEL